MKKAIITGVNGQDGSYLAELLLTKNYKVIGIVRGPSSSLKNLDILGILEKVDIIYCDLCDLDSVKNIINKILPDEIYNLSAQSSVSKSFNEPIDTIIYNTKSVLNILETIKQIDIEIKFYQASSSDMFGNVNTLPICIDTQMKPISPYAVSKASSFWSVISYRESYNLFAVSGILFNHESKLRTKTFFIKKVISDSVDIVFGKKKKLYVVNIEIKRDFGYAPKYVEAMWLMLQQKKPKDYLICSGKSIILREIIEYIFQKLNLSKDKIIVDKRLCRPSEIQDIFGTNILAKEELNWQYEMNFFDVIDELVEYELSNR